MPADPIGAMRHRLEIQQEQGATKNAMGEPVPSWVTVGERWGAIESLGGTEQWKARQVHPEASYRVKLWYFEGLSSLHRFKFGARILEIVSVSDSDETKFRHECLCKEKAAVTPTQSLS